ncbi:MAG: hypothetical protein P8J87_05155, partial [Verrucomicrobiales bacterium]|nr:hypothetical protein [Verrucomicrobiales bacterium]
MKPTPEIQKTIDNQISQLGISPVGIHIRRTDHHLQHLSPLGAFVSAMEVEIEKNPATKFFLATDCHQTK